MGYADLLLELFPRDTEGLNDGAATAAFLAEVASRGYLVLPQEIAFEQINELGAAHAWKPGIREEVQQALTDFNAGTSDNFDCYLRYCPPPAEDYGLLFRMTLYRSGTIFIGVNDATFSYNELGLTNYERFIAFVALVYQTWPLIYGYMSDGPSWEPDEVRNLQADALYELTIFGPEYVAKIGRDKFEALDVWRKLPMEDGGYIIAVGLYARYTDPNLLVHPTAKAEALGLESPDFMD
jgi:hypothetical protein